MESGLITNVRQATWTYVWRQQRWALIGLVLLWMGSSVAALATSIPHFLAIPVVVTYTWYFKQRFKIESAFMRQFAAANRFNYAESGNPSHHDSEPFRVPTHKSRSSSIITGHLSERPFELSYYDYTELGDKGGDGPHRRVTVMAIDLGRTMPNIIARCLQDGRPKQWYYASMGLPQPGNPSPLKTEGNFDSYYHLQTDKGEELEALQIFEPNVLEALIQQPRRFSFELMNNVLYIHVYGHVGDKATLDSLLAFSGTISNYLGREARSLHISEDVAGQGTPAQTSYGVQAGQMATVFTNAFIVLLFIVGIMLLLIELSSLVTPESSLKAIEVPFLASAAGMIGLAVALWYIRRPPKA